MNSKDILTSSGYIVTSIQIALYDCAVQFMQNHNMNRSQFAEHLGVSKGYVTQLLNGDYDHRLSKLVNLALACGYVPEIKFTPKAQFLSSKSDEYSIASYAPQDWSGKSSQLLFTNSTECSDYSTESVNHPIEAA